MTITTTRTINLDEQLIAALIDSARRIYRDLEAHKDDQAYSRCFPLWQACRDLLAVVDAATTTKTECARQAAAMSQMSWGQTLRER